MNEQINGIDIRKEFTAHELNETGVARVADVRKLFSVHLNNLSSVVGEGGREMSIVKTKLEEACMFAIRAVAVQPENQK